MTLLLYATAVGLITIVLITNLEGYNETQTLHENEFSNEYNNPRRIKRIPIWPPVYPTPDYTKPIKLKDLNRILNLSDESVSASFHCWDSFFLDNHRTVGKERPVDIFIAYVNCSEEDKHCNTTRKWNRYVPYKIEDDMTQSLKISVNNAIKTWNSLFKDCIEFTERKSEEDYVEFLEATTCHSKIGRKLGKQLILLDRDDCSSFGKIAHEMMHTVGLRHEHNRPDRDDYIQVLFKDLPPDWIQEYMKYEDFFFDELRTTPYDYYSVMHYPIIGPDKYTPAIKIIKKNIELDKVGLQKNMTSNDILKVKNLYCSKTSKNH